MTWLEAYIAWCVIFGLFYGFGYIFFWVATQTKLPMPKDQDFTNQMVYGFITMAVFLIAWAGSAILMPLVLAETAYKGLRKK